MKYIIIIECKTLTKIINFSIITYIKEDVETVKKDKFWKII